MLILTFEVNSALSYQNGPFFRDLAHCAYNMNFLHLKNNSMPFLAIFQLKPFRLRRAKSHQEKKLIFNLLNRVPEVMLKKVKNTERNRKRK